ncbi:MAG TPA: tetratricopeptide repeat protein [Terriglobales bacterium]|nr:tetratricopeptide repeat protein [Terriglobales bacterium]
MPRAYSRSSRCSPFLLLICVAALVWCNTPAFAQLQPAPPPVHVVEPPPRDWSAQQLEQRADSLRSEKLYLDAIDYYSAALQKKPKDSLLYNKMGIVELMLQRLKDAEKDFHRAIKADKNYGEAYNNLGAVYYFRKKYGKAVKQYRKAIKLYDDSASFHSNLGTAYFAQKKFELAIEEYSRALQIDPTILDRTSSQGVIAQTSSVSDRAHYHFMLAKAFAHMGMADRSLLYLRMALEEGYKSIDDVYKDSEFAGLRKDPRFLELMKTRPAAIPN